MTEIVFNSKVDTWLAAIFIGTILVTLFILYWHFKTNDSTLLHSIAISSIPVILTLGILLPTFFNTYYKINDQYLFIRSGFFSWTIPLSDIESMHPNKSLISSPALSTDRLKIVYGNKSILISPKDPLRFQKEIMVRKRNISNS